MRRPAPLLVLLGLVVLALLGYVFVAVTRGPAPARIGAPPSSAPAPPSTGPTGPPETFPPAGKVFLGVQTQHGPHDFADLDAFTTATGVTPGALQFSQS